MLRDLLEINYPKKVKKVKPVEISQLLKKFDSAGMSLGALSPDAHETLAEAIKFEKHINSAINKVLNMT